MQLRQALWLHDGDTDAIIHKDIQGGPDGCCGMLDFSIGTADEGRTVLEAWNRRTDTAPEAVKELVRAANEMVKTCYDCDGTGRTRASIGLRVEINCPVCLGLRKALAPFAGMDI